MFSIFLVFLVSCCWAGHLVAGEVAHRQKDLLAHARVLVADGVEQAVHGPLGAREATEGAGRLRRGLHLLQRPCGGHGPNFMKVLGRTGDNESLPLSDTPLGEGFGQMSANGLRDHMFSCDGDLTAVPQFTDDLQNREKDL